MSDYSFLYTYLNGTLLFQCNETSYQLNGLKAVIANSFIGTMALYVGLGASMFAKVGRPLGYKTEIMTGIVGGIFGSLLGLIYSLPVALCRTPYYCITGDASKPEVSFRLNWTRSNDSN